MSRGRELMARFAGTRRPRRVGPNRHEGRRIDELRAVASDVLAASSIPRCMRAAIDRTPRKDDLSDTVHVTMLTYGAGHDVAIGARGRCRHRRRRMSGVGSAFRPSIVTTAVTRAARAAPVAEVDPPVQVERLRRQFRAGGIDFEMTAVARAGIVRGGRRTVTIAATHRAGLAPGGTPAGSAAIVTCNGANAGRSIVTRMGSDPAIIENDFDAAVAVQSTDDLAAGCWMACRAGKGAPRSCSGIDVRRVRSCSRAIAGKKAGIARRKWFSFHRRDMLRTRARPPAGRGTTCRLWRAAPAT